MRTEDQQTILLAPEDLIHHLREGKEDAREILIKTYWDFIVSAAARMTGRHSESSDEFSVALQAFNEAIDSYDPEKNSSFLSFSGLVMNRRLIGYFRKSRKYRLEHSFSSLSPVDDGGEPELMSTAVPLGEAYEIQEELLEYKRTLLEYGITLDTLMYSAPKHEDTRALCVRIALKLYEDETLFRALKTEKRLPIAQLLRSFSLSRKTIEKNRKYIIALFLILNSDLEILKGYFSSSGTFRQKPAYPVTKGGLRL